MRKIAFLFPGQGAQEVGMGRDLFRGGGDDFAKKLFEVGSAAAAKDLKKICLRGPHRQLEDTAVLQPALTAVCLSYWKKLVDFGVKPAVVAGHSVGELSALAACEMADAAEMVSLAAQRGALMGAAAKKRQGAMAAVTGAPYTEVADFIRLVADRGCLSIAAVNAEHQIVVSGDMDLVETFVKTAPWADNVRLRKLRVSGAWHSEHMRSQRANFAETLAKVAFHSPSIPMIFNRDGEEASAMQVPERLASQFVLPVRWDLVVRRMLAMGTTDFVEIGPGKVLRGLLRLNVSDPTISVHNVSDIRSLERAASHLSD